MAWLKIALIGLAIRLLAIFYFSQGDNYQDGVFKIIVDVDYKVYLDASLYPSPYQRHTYRYPPAIAALVSPSHELHPLFGKVIIALFDAVAIILVYHIFAQRQGEDATKRLKAAQFIAYLYSLNPVLIYITTRGSCEGITMALTMLFWYLYTGGKVNGNISPVQRLDKGYTQRQPNKLKKYLSYAVFGLWVHFRVYPIILVPLLIMHEYYSAKNNKLKAAINFTIQFGLVSGGVFLLIAAYYYYLYGQEFIYSTYLYHILRRDNRHSKAAYFYQTYLNYTSDSLTRAGYSRFLNRILPTILAIFTISFSFAKQRSLFYCSGLIICFFVTFNRVITDQYYVWAFCAMYLGIPEMQAFREKKWSLTYKRVIKDHFLVPMPVILWLLMALQLQNKLGEINIFHLWLASLFILVIHTAIITKFFLQMKAYSADYEKKLRLEEAKRLLSGQKTD